jgi:hypothetical protein
VISACDESSRAQTPSGRRQEIKQTPDSGSALLAQNTIQRASSIDASGPKNHPDVIKIPVRDSNSGLPTGEAGIELSQIYHRAAERYASIDSYIARLRRREQVNGKDKPEELLLFKFRKQPWSVYLKWLGTEGKGREVIYVQGQHGSMLNTLLATGDMPFVPAGKRMTLPPDSFFVRAASRHAITEAGIGNLVEEFGKLVEVPPRNGSASAKLNYLGRKQRPEFEGLVQVVEQIIPPGSEVQLPHGGRRLWMFDPQTNLPAILVTTDETGHEVEYYCYDRLQCPVHLDDADFDPDRLWATNR